MTTALTLTSLLLPVGLGLLGFVEPCSIGSTLIVVKHLEDKGPAAKLAELGAFALTRAAFIGLLGVLAVLVGATFLWLQRGAWIALGAVYVMIGLLYLTGQVGLLMRSVGPKLGRISGLHGSVGLGVLLGLNIPACAAPLLIVLLGTAAAGGAAGAMLATGFISLALFGLALLGYGIPGFLFGPVIGRAADRLGRGRLLPIGFGLGALATTALMLDLPLAAAAIMVTILSLGYDMTQPLFAGIVTALGGKRPGQAMGLNVFFLFTGFGLGSLIFGAVLRVGFGTALGTFAAVEAAAAVASVALFRSELSARRGQ